MQIDELVTSINTYHSLFKKETNNSIYFNINILVDDAVQLCDDVVHIAEVVDDDVVELVDVIVELVEVVVETVDVVEELVDIVEELVDVVEELVETVVELIEVVEELVEVVEDIDEAKESVVYSVTVVNYIIIEIYMNKNNDKSQYLLVIDVVEIWFLIKRAVRIVTIVAARRKAASIDRYVHIGVQKDQLA